jgi:hypothetical protein
MLSKRSATDFMRDFETRGAQALRAPIKPRKRFAAGYKMTQAERAMQPS